MTLPASERPDGLAAVEQRLGALQAALAGADADRLQAEAAGLQRALGAAIGPLRREKRTGALDGTLRRRIATLAAEVTAQRELVARAGAAAGRALGVLLPDAAPPAGYGAGGHGQRPPSHPVATA